jgi:hypothetical protein
MFAGFKSPWTTRLTDQILHDDRHDAFAIVDGEHGTDGGMAACRRGPRFGQHARGTRLASLQNLERDLPIQDRVVRQVHRREAAVAQLPLDAVVRHHGPRKQLPGLDRVAAREPVFRAEPACLQRRDDAQDFVCASTDVQVMHHLILDDRIGVDDE